MHPEDAAALPLVCPACRSDEGGEISVHTVEPAAVWRRTDGGGIVDGVLACANRACGKRYPVVGGLPLLVRDLAALLESELPALLACRAPLGEALPVELAALLVEAAPDDAPLGRLFTHLTSYLDAAWGDHATPPPEVVGERLDPLGARALVERLAARAASPVEQAVELGCGVGRAAVELARGARRTVGVDLHTGAVAHARALAAGEIVRYARRTLGRQSLPVTLRPPPGARGLTFVVGDALDPPLAPGQFQRAAALHVLDSVRNPHQLLVVLDALLAPGGELLLATPFSWSSAATAEDHRLGGPDELVALLERGEALSAPYRIVDRAELPWTLRRDARSLTRYTALWLRAEKKV